MGELKLAQRILRLCHELYGRTSGPAQAVLDWVSVNRELLWPRRVWPEDEPAGDPMVVLKPAVTWDMIPALAAELGPGASGCPLHACVAAVADQLALEPFDRALLDAAVTMQRSPLLASLRMRLGGAGGNELLLLGTLAGADPAHAPQAVRRSKSVTLGLLVVENERAALDLAWTFDRLLDRGALDETQLLAALVGVRQVPKLGPEDFTECKPALDLLCRMLSGALRSGAKGVNVLLHGPPGTGKTEFARTLAAGAGAALIAVGELDWDGEEPDRCARLQALRRAQRMLARRRDTLLLFDEMEDLFAPQPPGCGQHGSKLFVNRLFEDNAVPVIWTSNALCEVDPAHLRRMSYVFRMGHPSAKARARIVARVAAEEGVPKLVDALAPLVANEAETAGIARLALRGANLADAEPAEAETIARSLLAGLRGGQELAFRRSAAPLHLDLFESDPAIPDLVARIAAPGAPADVSMLLAGPPGTGKTALAAELADRLDRPLLVKRTSDLLSKWVGGTEANIAAAFAEARADDAVLLFDEADSLLLDRADARHSWERTQVNELLTWMDEHPLPFIAATNHPQRLDPAAMRRFVFKLSLDTLGPERAALAWTRFFPHPPPPALARVAGLTPGDFAVVASQLRFGGAAEPEVLLRLLEAEVRAKLGATGRIGF